MAERTLVVDLEDRGTLTRIVRAVLDNGVAHVPLASPPLAGVYTLQLRVAGRPGISVAAEPTSGTAMPHGFPMRLSPLDPSHVGELAALLEEPLPISKSASAIFDSKPPLPSGPNGPATDLEPDAIEVDTDDLDQSLGHTPTTDRSNTDDWKKTDPDALAGARPPPSGTPTNPFPLQRRLDRRLEEMPVSEDSGTMRSSQRGPQTMLRQHAILGVGSVVAGKYRIEAHIGSGSVGAVYRASHADLGRDVALKVLHPHYRSDAHLLASFRSEARAASLLRHPNVTVVHDFGTDVDGTIYIVMELLAGSTLQSIIDDQRRIEPVRAIKLMLQVTAALAAAHELGVVHRDVKPDNIIVAASRDDDGDPYEHVKVCDFGIAALQTGGANDGGELTLTAGTPEYMAPEQARGRADARTDVYACGVLLYEMLIGRPPFVGETASEILRKHATEAPRPLVELGVASQLDEIVLRALEKAEERRWESARDLRSALKRLLF